jgi:mRNA interferase RelE/StbE
VRIEWHEAAVENLKRLDGTVRRRIRDVLQDELPKHPDPRRKLEPYKGPLKGYWKLRVGDWRLVCALEGLPTTRRCSSSWWRTAAFPPSARACVG